MPHGQARQGPRATARLCHASLRSPQLGLVLIGHDAQSVLPGLGGVLARDELGNMLRFPRKVGNFKPYLPFLIER